MECKCEAKNEKPHSTCQNAIEYPHGDKWYCYLETQILQKYRIDELNNAGCIAFCLQDGKGQIYPLI